MYYNHVFVLSCRLPSLWMIRIILGLRDIVSRDVAEPNLQAGLASCDRRLMGQAECIVLELDFWYLNYLNIKNRDLTWFDQLGTNNHGNIHIYTYIHIYILEDHRVVFSIWGCSWNREGQDNTNCVIFNRETVMVWGTHLYQEAIFFGYGSNDLQWVQYNHRSCEYLCIASLQPTTSKSFAWGLWHWQIMYPFCFAMLGLFADSTQAIPSRPTSELIYDRLLPTQHGKNCQHAWHGPA